MKKTSIVLVSLFGLVVFGLNATYAASPVTKEWVLQQIASNQRFLSTADWNAICTSGTATSASGCYGNVSSAAFTKVSDHIGGFTTYANINPVSTPSSVYIKSFFGGTNTPAQPTYLHINVSNSAARCGLFTEAGFGLGEPGIATNVPGTGSSAGGDPISAGVASINNALSTTDVDYNGSISGTLSNVGGPQQQYPIYLVCVGYNPNNGSTAAAINITAT